MDDDKKPLCIFAERFLLFRTFFPKHLQSMLKQEYTYINLLARKKQRILRIV